MTYSYHIIPAEPGWKVLELNERGDIPREVDCVIAWRISFDPDCNDNDVEPYTLVHAIGIANPGGDLNPSIRYCLSPTGKVVEVGNQKSYPTLSSFISSLSRESKFRFKPPPSNTHTKGLKASS